MAGRHKWTFVRVAIGPRGSRLIIKRCTRCGLEASNQSFSRAETPYCHEQQRILFDGERPPRPARAPRWPVPAVPPPPLVPDDLEVYDTWGGKRGRIRPWKRR